MSIQLFKYFYVAKKQKIIILLAVQQAKILVQQLPDIATGLVSASGKHYYKSLHKQR